MTDAHPSQFDQRLYVRLDQGMPENPKIIALSDSAFRIYVEAICWCSRQRSDGVISEAALRRLGRPKPIQELKDGRLFEFDGQNWRVHDYLFHQRSSAEIDVIKDAKADAGAKGAHARWHVARRRVDPTCPLCVPGLQTTG